MIATPDGDRAIESLALGDLVVTASGGSKPVKWIGRWKATQFVGRNWNWSNIPVRISSGAIDGRLPHRDLYVSGMHCMFIDGTLIPAADLVNGVTILKDVPHSNEELEYFHIELESHDILIANGAASESLRCNPGDRQRFDNGAEYLDLYGAEPAASGPCAPISANNTLRKSLLSWIRTTAAPVLDVRKPHEVVRARLAKEANRLAA